MFRPANAIGDDPGDRFSPGAHRLAETVVMFVRDGGRPNSQERLFVRDDLKDGAGIVSDEAQTALRSRAPVLTGG